MIVSFPVAVLPAPPPSRVAESIWIFKDMTENRKCTDEETRSLPVLAAPESTTRRSLKFMETSTITTSLGNLKRQDSSR
ncbi:hypothetical protein GALMADRAFT_400364 [Galerina marginata CBS 339.88]|uniref:Uncharacterized protein n=1 Tax=Galerina marginata (strain CBS 339.88) TaxID=685588 RepID=A0A067TS66_GALM3|nr:hypothetical protein GALMADRAFT_400364 [Galerina marginata CBS 339.88]